MKAFTENSADSIAVLLRAGEGEISENGSGAARLRIIKGRELAEMQKVFLAKEKQVSYI